ncbi:hypothetical protein ACWGDT_35780 [Streptomyces avermitilis]
MRSTWGDDEDGLVPGDEEDEPEGAVFPALRILKDAVQRSKMHPIPVIRAEEREDGPWPLISEDMDGEPGWVHPDVTSSRVAHIRDNGKRVRRDQLDVSASFGDGVMCLIDRNGSYPSACSAVPLAPNKLLHTGPLDAFDKTQAKERPVEISGTVKTGNDERERGTRRAAPLRIDGRRGDWTEIEELWNSGDLTDSDFEDHFIDDVVVADIGEGTDGWDFPGSSYVVELR